MRAGALPAVLSGIPEAEGLAVPAPSDSRSSGSRGPPFEASRHGSANDPHAPDTADDPGDIPAGRPAMLTRLHVLAGERDIEVSSESGYSGPGTPPAAARGGRTTSEWLDGQFFLIQRFSVENPAAPSGISIIGLGERRQRTSRSTTTTRAESPASTR
jgi:hypothetical protein